MSEMVERVARAIYGAYRGASDWDEDNYRMDESVREEWREVAKAAIEAMREPTDQMVNVAPEACDFEVQHAPHIRAIWRAMIDAALKEPDFTLTVENPDPEPMKVTVTGVDHIR